jgi:translation initiation factor 2B subunit (eIF-2B alpha/beta/delta family)
MFNLVNMILLESGEPSHTESLQRRVDRGCDEFAARLRESDDSIRRKATGLIRAGDTVMTHSASSAVQSCLLAAGAQGKAMTVYCTESRPVNEGVNLARELARQGIEVRLIVDAAAPSFLADTDVVLVGADSISTLGLVNKAGTLGLVVAADALGVDVYALCGTAKFLPSGLPPLPQDLRDPAEVLSDPPANLTPVNRYFDTTPLKYFTGVVTETGILPPGQVEQALLNMRVHPRLKEFLGD